MTTTEVPTANDLREQIREWRRGRAELKITEVLSDAYVALFTVVMVAAMGGNVVLSLRRLADATCAGPCAQVRSSAPWLVALAVTLVTLGLARLLGPVFSPPAANAWLLGTPVERGALLRPGWSRTATFTVVGAAAVLVVPALLGGLDLVTGVTFVGAGAATALACVGVAALAQIRELPVARWLTWLIAGGLWLALSLSATQRPGTLPFAPTSLLLGGALVAAVIGLTLFRLARRDVATVPRRVLGYTENLSPSLSGALSSLDLGLMYDVLLARRWGRGATVRSHRGGPLGWWALVHRDLRRAARTPQPYALLVGLVLVPYAAAEANAGRAVVLITTLIGLLAGPALCAGLRVVVRTQSLARMLPMSRSSLLSAHLVVPGAALLLFGASTTGALLPTLPPDAAVVVALACGLSGVAATTRWVTGKPPNYATPMVSTPLGGLPPGMASSVLRGFDVWAVTALPLMFGPIGVLISIAISLAVIAFLLSGGPSLGAAR